MPPSPLTHNDDGTSTVRITKLRQLILETHKPQYQTAAAAGIHPYTLSLYVQGKRDINTQHLAKLSEVLHHPPEQIVGWVSYTLDENGEICNTETL